MRQASAVMSMDLHGAFGDGPKRIRHNHTTQNNIKRSLLDEYILFASGPTDVTLHLPKLSHVSRPGSH
jgi:hypothetical protein